MLTMSASVVAFLSTPSGWRATLGLRFHAELRVAFLSTPSGWRATRDFGFRLEDDSQFLSTPSGWRATVYGIIDYALTMRFLSTPSGWRATRWLSTTRYGPKAISIHALRVEGDFILQEITDTEAISIHALRVEGDMLFASNAGWLIYISIHALRVEGDGHPEWHIQGDVLFLSTPSGWRATR